MVRHNAKAEIEILFNKLKLVRPTMDPEVRDEVVDFIASLEPYQVEESFSPGLSAEDVVEACQAARRWAAKLYKKAKTHTETARAVAASPGFYADAARNRTLVLHRSISNLSVLLEMAGVSAETARTRRGEFGSHAKHENRKQLLRQTLSSLQERGDLVGFAVHTRTDNWSSMSSPGMPMDADFKAVAVYIRTPEVNINGITLGPFVVAIGYGGALDTFSDFEIEVRGVLDPTVFSSQEEMRRRLTTTYVAPDGAISDTDAGWHPHIAPIRATIGTRVRQLLDVVPTSEEWDAWETLPFGEFCFGEEVRGSRTALLSCNFEYIYMYLDNFLQHYTPRAPYSRLGDWAGPHLAKAYRMFVHREARPGEALNQQGRFGDPASDPLAKALNEGWLVEDPETGEIRIKDDDTHTLKSRLGMSFLHEVEPQDPRLPLEDAGENIVNLLAYSWCEREPIFIPNPQFQGPDEDEEDDYEDEEDDYEDEEDDGVEDVVPPRYTPLYIQGITDHLQYYTYVIMRGRHEGWDQALEIHSDPSYSPDSRAVRVPLWEEPRR